MLTVYHSNNLHLLKDLVLHLSEQQRGSNPFQAELMLVQSTGMGQWLKQQLAKARGIAALVECQLPARFVWDCYTRVLPGLEKDSPFSKAAMTWKLMTLFPQCLDEPEFAPLAHYLREDTGLRKRYQLAGKVADLFDQYLMYRPQWLSDWEQGGDMAATSQPWQPILWRRLLAYTEELGQVGLHRSSLNQTVIERLNQAPMGCFEFPEQLFIFGISALPPQYLELLVALGKHMDVHLLVHNPCQEFWRDIRDKRYLARFGSDDGYLQVGNPLLASFGKLGRDYLALLQDMTDAHQAGVGEIRGFVAADEETTTLLTALQADILHLEDRTELPCQVENLVHSRCKTVVDPADRSVVLHSCHSPTREVEVLHDQLLAMLAADPTLTPKDIIVMMPDINAYAPAISAVFGSVPAQRYIPYAISDRAARQEHPIINGFLRLLSLPRMRASASELLELLEIPALLSRFQLDRDDFDQLHQWVAEVNIRWGLDGASKEELGLPPDQGNSWLFGLQRMLAGYALSADEGLLGDILPFDEVEGLAAAKVGKLAEFIEKLRYWTDALRQPATFSVWFERLNDILDGFFEPADDEQLALQLVRGSIETLAGQLEKNAMTDPLPVEVIEDWLCQKLDGDTGSNRFLAGSVNFCTLMPMRAIPFRVVCLLGMNDGIYPRTIAPLGFDLIHHNGPERGDRSRREDDRYLFLEALLAAEESLYISYIGRSVQDNSERIPSVLVSELLEYLEQSFVLPEDIELSGDASGEQLRAHLITEHPLQPFSEQYFTNQSAKLFSYASEWRQVLTYRPLTQTEEPLAQELPEALELPDLVRCMRNPARFFFNQRLKVYFERSDEALEDDEPFALDGLAAFQLKSRWLQALDKGSAETLAPRLRAEGWLPGHAFGELELADTAAEIEPFWSEQIEPRLSQPQPDQEVRLNLGGIQLEGWVKGCTSEGILRYRVVRGIKGADLQALWLDHLALCCMGLAPRSRLLALTEQAVLAPVPKAQAEVLLKEWLYIWQEAHNSLFPYLPNPAWLLVSGEEEKGWQQALTTLAGQGDFRGELDDPYLRRLGLEAEAYLEALEPLASRLLTPILDFISSPEQEASHG